MNISENFYESCADAFSDTRFCLWDVVKEFGNQFKKSDLVCDAGCGNGKNIKYFQDKCNMIGFDKSNKLVSICKNKGYNVNVQDILNTNYSSELFDYVLSIAVIHHLDSEEKHISAIQELLRILKINGKLLFTLWAFESDEYSKKKKFQIGHNYINFNKSERYYYIYDESLLKNMLKKIENNNYMIKYWWERGNWNIIIQKIKNIL